MKEARRTMALEMGFTPYQIKRWNLDNPEMKEHAFFTMCSFARQEKAAQRKGRQRG